MTARGIRKNTRYTIIFWPITSTIRHSGLPLPDTDKFTSKVNFREPVNTTVLTMRYSRLFQSVTISYTSECTTSLGAFTYLPSLSQSSITLESTGTQLLHDQFCNGRRFFFVRHRHWSVAHFSTNSLLHHQPLDKLYFSYKMNHTAPLKHREWVKEDKK